MRSGDEPLGAGRDGADVPPVLAAGPWREPLLQGAVGDGPPRSLPPGAASFSKIGVVYVPIAPDGRPMMELLTPDQQADVRATLGSPYNKCIKAGLTCCILEFMLCPCIMVPCFLCSLRKAADVERRLREEAIASLMTAQQLQQAGISPHPAAGGYPSMLPHIAAMAAAQQDRGPQAGGRGGAAAATGAGGGGAGAGAATAPAGSGGPDAAAGGDVTPAEAALAGTDSAYEPVVDRAAEEPASARDTEPVAVPVRSGSPFEAAAREVPAETGGILSEQRAGERGTRLDEERPAWV